jgi:hypothetical protein
MISRQGNIIKVNLENKNVDVSIDMVRGYLAKAGNELGFALQGTEYADLFKSTIAQSRFTKDQALKMVETVSTALAYAPQLKQIDWSQLVNFLPQNIKDEINRIVQDIGNTVERIDTGINWTFFIVLLIIFLIGWWLWYKSRN